MRHWITLLFNRISEVRRQHRVRLKEEHTFEYFMERVKYLNIILIILVWFGTAGALMFRISECPPILYQSNRIHAANGVTADISFSYPDSAATQSAKIQAMKTAPFVFNVSADANAAIKAEFVSAFSRIRGKPEKRDLFFKDYDIGPVVAENLYSYVKNVQFEVNFFEKLEMILVRGVLDTPLIKDYPITHDVIITSPPNRRFPIRPLGAVSTVNQAAEQLATIVLRPYYEIGIMPETESALTRIIHTILSRYHGNLIPEPEETLILREATARQVKPIVRDVTRGTPIVRPGQTVTPTVTEMWEAYHHAVELADKAYFSIRGAMEMLLGSLLIMIITGVYIASICPELLKSNRKLWSIGMIGLFCLGLNCLIIRYANTILTAINASISVVDLLPLALAPALLTAILGLRAGLFSGLFISFVTAIQFDTSFEIALGGMVLTFIVSYTVERATDYRSFFTRVMLGVLFSAGLLKLISIIGEQNISELWKNTLVCVAANAILTAILAMLILFSIEYLFGVTTDMSLSALTNANHPLLKHLQIEAPGTYYHSLMVANLAEQAAIDIGVNPVRTRAAALFHDIGKLKQPEYFTENQAKGESPHRNLKPSLSALKIQSHVDEGIERAIRYRLPSLIRNAIQQHHGTDKVGYFYKQAMDAGQEGLDENVFHYPGPLPSEKETVIVSLADACEAAARSLEKPTHSKIEALVWDIFRARLRNGQLDDAQLSLHELGEVRDSFVKTLATMYHSRIAYPKDDSDDQDDLFNQTQTIRTKNS